MSTAIMSRAGMAPPAVRRERDRVRSFDVLRIVRPCALALAACAVPLLVIPPLALVACFALPCMPLVLPFLALGMRGLPLFPPAPRPCVPAAEQPTRTLRGRLWDAREFAAAEPGRELTLGPRCLSVEALTVEAADGWTSVHQRLRIHSDRVSRGRAVDDVSHRACVLQLTGFQTSTIRGRLDMLSHWNTGWNEFDEMFSAMNQLRSYMDRVFENAFGGDPWNDRSLPSLGAWPRANLVDAGANIVVTAEVPGISEDDLKVALNENVLTISGERRVETPEGYSAHRQERSSVNFSRSFTLPCRVNADRTTASVRNGILTVTIEKAEDALPRKITVKAS